MKPWKLTIHKWDGQTWAEEIIEGPSPTFTVAIGEHVSTRWHFQDISIFPLHHQVHLWLTPVWENPATPLHPKSLAQKRA